MCSVEFLSLCLRLKISYVSPQLGEQLAALIPSCGVDIVELEDEGTCVRFNPLMTSAGRWMIHFFVFFLY